MKNEAAFVRPGLSLIVARAQNGVIGRDNDMPWSLPDDLRRFKTLTRGKPVIMGRNTWESLPRRPLPKRPNIVVSRNSALQTENAWLVANLEQALATGEAMAAASGVMEYFVIGGAMLYRDALPLARTLYLTEIEAEIAGDTYFPVFDESDWHEVCSERLPSDEKNSHPTRYRQLERLM